MALEIAKGPPSPFPSLPQLTASRENSWRWRNTRARKRQDFAVKHAYHRKRCRGLILSPFFNKRRHAVQKDRHHRLIKVSANREGLHVQAVLQRLRPLVLRRFHLRHGYRGGSWLRDEACPLWRRCCRNKQIEIRRTAPCSTVSAPQMEQGVQLSQQAINITRNRQEANRVAKTGDKRYTRNTNESPPPYTPSPCARKLAWNPLPSTATRKEQSSCPSQTSKTIPSSRGIRRESSLGTGGGLATHLS